MQMVAKTREVTTVLLFDIQNFFYQKLFKISRATPQYSIFIYPATEKGRGLLSKILAILSRLEFGDYFPQEKSRHDNLKWLGIKG